MENFTMLQYFQWYYPADGSLWKKMNAEATQIKAFGIDTLWLPPAYKGMDGKQSPGYDVYDHYDLGEFDQKGSVITKYGSKEELIDAIKSAKQAGLQVYMDIVLNHLGGADETEKIPARKVNPQNRLEFISEVFEISAYTKFKFPGRNGKYSNFEWDFQCFTGVDFDEATGESAIYSIQNQYGDAWQDVLDTENGNYDYLMLSDIDFRNPSVTEELKKWGEWFHNTLNFDGFRLDAIKHMPPGFYKDWLDHMRSVTGKELFTVGEYWSPGKLDDMLKYIEATGERMSLFDACLQNNFSIASKQGNGFDLTKIFEGTLVQVKPELAVTLVENHDTQPLQSLEQTVEYWFRSIAYALILLRTTGYPCIFYPDLYGASYCDKGNDGSEHEIFLEPVAQIQTMLGLRKNNVYGEQRDYFDHPNCVGWTVGGIQEKGGSGIAVILSNGDDGIKDMEIGKKFAGKIFRDRLGNIEQEVPISDEGWGTFYCSAGSVSAYTAD
ncbi:alpha-amylase [Pedobacter sp. Leaf176]|uniref:alpha-amylase n=1 Tax=Pedobacter sp. Leaf176 TaxID=1736286 RepID=UPI0006F79E62|nr:alpha-amylase [Pedobacter sp. Leaf176]KQR66929.1 alpha-amylase [Pedobacter sp. Leaf176]